MRNVLIVDDHEPTRRGVRNLLSSDPEWLVCGEARDGIQAVEQAKQLHPDLIIMDVSMPKMNGVEATKVIRRDVGKSRILMISQNDPAVLIRQSVEANAHGCLAKSDLARNLLTSIEKLMLTRDDEKTEPKYQVQR